MIIMGKQEFLACLGLQGWTLEVWLEQRWLLPEQPDTGLRFSDIDVARARLIQELTARLGVNNEGVDVILHLMDQLHGLRQALAQLRDDLPIGSV